MKVLSLLPPAKAAIKLLKCSAFCFGVAAAIANSNAQAPVAYYPLNGDATDASGNGLNGSLVGTTPTTDRYGNAGGALLFVNDTDRVICGNAPAFNFSGPFTISAWVNVNGTRANSYIVAKYNTAAGAAHSYGLGVAGVPYPYGFVGNDFGYADLIGFAAPMNVNQWYALSCVYDGATLSLFSNGDLIAQTFVGAFPPFVNDAPLTIGGTYDGFVIGGAIDDVRIYDHALTQADIVAQYQADLPPPPSNDGTLVAYYKFSGGNATDNSGNGLNGTVAGAEPTTDRNGRKNSALAFDGASDRVNLGNPSAFNFNGNFTLSAWIKMSGTQLNKYVVAKYDFDASTLSSSQFCYGFGVDGSAEAYGFVGSFSSYIDLRAGPSLNDGGWHAIAFAYQGADTIRLYVDGLLVGSRPVPVQPPFVNSVPVTIGGALLDQSFGGSIDEVRLYSKALSNDEIAAQYQLDAPRLAASSLKAGLVARYKLDGDARDSSGNNLDGVLTGTTQVADRFGRSGKALHFNGVSDLINCGNAAQFNFTNSFTLSTWLKVDGDQTAKYLITKYGDVVEHSYGLGIGQDTDPYGFLGGNFGYIDQLTFANMNDNKWHLVSMVYEYGNTLRLYLDAELVASKFAGVFPPFINSAPLTIGGRLSGQNFQGAMDDVRLYNRALSPEELTVLMEQK
jgi:hypothetical protein